MPRATSSEIAPLGITSIGARVSSPRRMTAPLPCCRSICASAAVSAFSRSMPAIVRTLRFPGRWTQATLEVRSDTFDVTAPSVDRRALWTPAWTQVIEQMFGFKPTRRHADTCLSGVGADDTALAVQLDVEPRGPQIEVSRTVQRLEHANVPPFRRSPH